MVSRYIVLYYKDSIPSHIIQIPILNSIHFWNCSTPGVQTFQIWTCLPVGGSFENPNSKRLIVTLIEMEPADDINVHLVKMRRKKEVKIMISTSLYPWLNVKLLFDMFKEKYPTAKIKYKHYLNYFK